MTKKPNRDYYSLFNIPLGATQEEIKKIYRKLAILYHPDKNPKSPLAEERFRLLQEAYSILGDPQKRRIYDQSQRGSFSQTNLRYQRAGRSGVGGSGVRGTQDHHRGKWGEGRSQRTKQTSSTPSSQGFQRAQGSKNPQSEHLRYTLSLSLEEVARGIERKIAFMRKRGGFESEAKLSVKVPAGIREGQRLKLKGEGESSFRGRTPGDLYIIISIQDHPLFHREGHDIFMTLPLSFKDAILGTKVDVPTLWGGATLTVPSYTSTGTILRLRKQGLPSSKRKGSYGDMMVKVVIDIPRHLGRKDLKGIRDLNLSHQRYSLIEDYEKKLKRLRRSA